MPRRVLSDAFRVHPNGTKIPGELLATLAIPAQPRIIRDRSRVGPSPRALMWPKRRVFHMLSEPEVRYP